MRPALVSRIVCFLHEAVEAVPFRSVAAASSRSVAGAQTADDEFGDYRRSLVKRH